MLTNTHKLLSKMLLNTVEGTRNFSKAQKLAFRWGNIRPDMHTPITKGKHMFDHSFDEVFSFWNYAEKQFDFDGVKCSYYLGIVLHFVADYFTLVHNDDASMNDLKSHFAYERKLHDIISHSVIVKTNDDFNGDFKKYIEDLHKEYLAGEHSIERDCEYILRSTYAITQWATASVNAYNFIPREVVKMN